MATRKPMSAETKAKISAALAGRTKSAGTRQAIAAARKGTKHSDETKAKISDSMRRK